MASIDEMTSAQGVKTWKVYWDLPKFMVPSGQKRAKGSLTLTDYNHALVAKRFAEEVTPRHAVTGEEISARVTAYFAPKAKKSMTLAEWSEEYLNLKRNDIRVRTMRDYRNQLRDVILPALGHRPIAELTGMEIKNFLNDVKAEREITFKRCDRFFALIKAMLEVATKNSLIEKNPARDAGWKLNRAEPAKEEDVHAERYFEPEQYEMLLSEIRSDFKLFVRFLCETGSRFSEAANLRVRDLDAKYNTARIRFVISAGESELPKGNKQRTVEVAPSLMKDLCASVQDKDSEDLVFTSSRGMMISNTNFRRDHWDPAMIRLQQCPDHLPMKPYSASNAWLVVDKKRPSDCKCLGDRVWTSFTPHALRHTYATWMIQNGRSLPLVAKQLGHANTNITEKVYVHLEYLWRRDAETRLSNTLDQILGRESKGGTAVEDV